MRYLKRTGSLLGRCSIKGALAATLIVCASASGTPALAQETKVEAGMSPIDVLLVKDAIRENWAEYNLLIDGDGVTNRGAEWAQRTFTDDAKWRWYTADGRLIMEYNSMEELRKRTTAGGYIGAHPEILQQPYKHLPITIKYDEITPTTAKTRTTVLFIGVPKATKPGMYDTAPGSQYPGVPTVGMAVYHDTWRKEHGQWMKSASYLYSANASCWPPDPTLPCPTRAPTESQKPKP